jgi:hypothetical protein
MINSQSCPITPPDQSQVEVVSLSLEETGDFQQAMAMAKREAEKRFDDYMLLSWYDRDRDFESPAGATECSHGVPGYVLYGLSHGAKLKIDFGAGRFVFFFAPVEW